MRRQMQPYNHLQPTCLNQSKNSDSWLFGNKAIFTEVNASYHFYFFIICKK